MNDLAFWFNVVEAAFWIVLGVAMLITSARPAPRWPWVLAGITFIAFGVSDIVETRTGAWWRPWWLLAWKAACLFVLAALALRWWRTRSRERANR